MALFVLSLCPFDISAGVGAFVIGLSQISSFFLLIYKAVYFQHDTTVAALLSTLGLFKDFPSPPYAASVLVELYEVSKGSYVVNLFYKQNATTAQQLMIKGNKIIRETKN